jgi:hypothetical protein
MQDPVTVVYRHVLAVGNGDVHVMRQAIGWTRTPERVESVIDQYKATHPDWETDTIEFHSEQQET